jgi:hypothetical protein
MEFAELRGPTGAVARIWPERGAAVVSLRLPDGLEVLAQGLRPPSGSGDFAADGLGGYDDCFPSITGQPGIQDHGELWSGPWSISDQSESRLVASCILPSAVVEREMVLGADALRVRVTVRALQPLEFLWAGHLLLAVDDETELELGSPIVSPEANGLDLDAGVAVDLASVWPRTGGRHHWSNLAEEIYVKAFQPVTATPPALHRHGHRITITTDQPWWGLWINKAGFPAHERFEHLGIEPCTSPHDALSQAVASGSAVRLAAGGAYSAGFSVGFEVVSLRGQE